MIKVSNFCISARKSAVPAGDAGDVVAFVVVVCADTDNRGKSKKEERKNNKMPFFMETGLKILLSTVPQVYQ